MKNRVTVWVMVCCLLICGAASASNFDFPRGEICLVEPEFESYLQDRPHVTFDYDGNVHAVYEDSRASSTPHMFCRSFTADGKITPSYRGYNGTDTDPHMYPFVFPSGFETDKLFAFIANTLSTTYDLETAEIDLSTLPASPGVSDLSTNITFGAMGLELIDMATGGSKSYFVYKQSGDDNLQVGMFDQSVGLWGSNYQVTAPADHSLENARIAVDAADFIYLVYDKEYYGGTPSYSIMVRRSVSAGDLSGGFQTERNVAGSSERHMYPRLAVNGSSGGNDLKVAIAYNEFQTGVSQQIKCSVEDMGDFTSVWSGDFTGALNSDLTDTLVINGPEIEIDSTGNMIYVVWHDDRMGYTEFYGNYSDDGGATFQAADDRFASGISNIIGPFSMAGGPQSGDLALAYIRFNGSHNVPMTMFTSASYFDSCDIDPAIAGFWDQYPGVSVDTFNFFSEPASYQLATGKGTLLHQYPTEMRGQVTLQFYDDPSIVTEDFYVGLENANEKGVIRMLGVRNDTTQSNYSYSMDSGVTWQDTGLLRSPGWHQVTFLVDESGMTMGMQSGPDSFSVNDITMTAFTTISISGGSTSNPYNVDDIRIEAYEYGLNPTTDVPSMSLIGLLIALSGMGLMISRQRFYAIRNRSLN